MLAKIPSIPSDSLAEADSPARGISQPSLLSAWRLHVLALVLTSAVAVLDLAIPRSNFSMLYVAPLLLFALAGANRGLAPMVLALVGLTFGIYVLKNVVHAPATGPELLDMRLLNRAFVALLLVATTAALAQLARWHDEPHEAELPAVFRHQDQEIGGTLAMLVGAVLVVLVGLIDFLVPANINLAILYPLPLFFCAWVESRRLLWCMSTVLFALTFLSIVVNATVTSPEHQPTVLFNRALAALAIAATGVILHVWIGRRQSGVL